MEIINFLQSFSTPFLDKLFESITSLAEESMFILIAVTMYWCFNKRAAFKITFILLLSMIVNGSIKDIVRAERPIGLPGIFSLRVETATGHSFPSGHTQGATTFWISLMTVYKNKLFYFIGSLLIILVAISRLYLGVHWPTDVLGGFFFGIVSILLGSLILKLKDYYNNHLYILLLVIPAILGMIFFHSSDYIKAAALVVSFYLGYIIEDEHIKFIESSPPMKQFIKLLIGFTGILVTKVLLKSVLPAGDLSNFIRYCLLGFWVICAAPYIFIKLSLSKSHK